MKIGDKVVITSSFNTLAEKEVTIVKIKSEGEFNVAKCSDGQTYYMGMLLPIHLKEEWNKEVKEQIKLKEMALEHTKNFFKIRNKIER